MIHARIAVLLAAICGLTGLSAGQFLIVPKGERAGSVTPKALRAEMHAHGAYGIARLELTFATDPNWSNEVDFMMRLPDNTEATGFAYWFGDEYVVAKTVEKERAAQIYQWITARQRDPALVELVGRRQFRVRIAPIDATKDLRVEIKLVVTQTEGALALPLTALFHNRLEHADLTLTTPDGWRENWGRVGAALNGRGVYRFESKPWTPKTDWRAAPPAAPVTVSVGRPTEGEGTILVAYTAKRDESNVRLTGPIGVLRHVYPAKASLKAGQTVTFSARVAANAPATVGLVVGTHRWQQALPRRPFVDRAAVVAWGANHVAALKDKNEIQKWGMWLSIPTKETSWLAVPKAEEATLKRARFEVAAREYWLIVAKHGKDSKLATTEFKRVRSLFREAEPTLKTERQIDLNMNWRLNNAANDMYYLLAEQYGRAVARGGKGSSAARGFAAGMRSLHATKAVYDYRQVSVEDALADAIGNAIHERVYKLLPYDEGEREATPSSRDPELTRLWGALSANERKEMGVPGRVMEGLEAAERLRLGIQVQQNPPDRRLAADAVKLAPIFGNVTQLRGEARANVAHYDLVDLARAWFGTQQKPKQPGPIEQRIVELDRRLRKFQLTSRQAREPLFDIVVMDRMRAQPHAPDPTKPLLSADQLRFIRHYRLGEVPVLRRMYDDEYRNATYRWANYAYMTRRNPAEVVESRKELEAWAKVLAKKPPATPQEVPNAGTGDPARDDYVFALRKYGPNHPTTREARLAMEARDQRWGRTNRIPVRAEILQLDLEIDRLLWRPLTPEETAKRDEMERRRKELFARMGDPLLIVEAPPTARVSARLPDGRLVSLGWNGQAMRWEHRFDLPPGSQEGSVEIPVWIRLASGATESKTVRIHVDQTPPAVTVEWIKLPNGWRVRATTEAGVARVNLALADGRRLVLSRIAMQGDGIVWQIDIAGDVSGEAIVIATDAAHNRTEVRKSFSPSR